MGLFRAVTLAAMAFAVCSALDDPLETRWRALQANCSSSSPPRRYDDVSLSAAVALLDELALSATSRSQWLHDFGEWHLLHSGNVTRAEDFLRASAAMGHARAQFLVGALTATSATPSPAESAVFYQFAATGGSTSAALALGYRHFVGYHAPKSCETAMRYYKTVADDVMRHRHALPNRVVPIQVFSMPPPARLSDDQTKLPQMDHDERDRVEYLRHRAASSSAKVDLLVRTASLLLFSDLYQDATQAHQHAQRDAVNFLERAVKKGNTLARALLGHVYAYGLARSPIDKQKAFELYENAYKSSNATVNGQSEAANGLGLLYLHSEPSDVERAMVYFQAAARGGHADGVFNAASIMARVEPQRSIQYLEASAVVGHVGAKFKLARVQEKQQFQSVGTDNESRCEAIVKTYKQVAEYHEYGRALLKRAAEAFLSGRYEHSLRLYRIAAELGFEVAEHNAAWLTERYVFSSLQDAVERPAYMQLVRRGIAQHSVDALVRAGDMDFTRGNYRLAMKQYLRAMEMQPTHARALYSAGHMCEWGLGTVHNGRNLERARWYYAQAQRHEPLLAYALPLAMLRIDVEIAVVHWIQEIHRLVAQAFKYIEAADETTNPILVFDDAATTSSTVSAPVAFASAMAFDGVSSRVTVETTSPSPSPLRGLTLDVWLWIEHPPSPTTESAFPSQVLFEWLHTLRVELVPHRDHVSWQMRVRGSESYQSVLTLTNAVFRSRRWYRVAVTVGAATRKVELRVDGEVADTGNLLVSFSSTQSRSMIHVGHSPGQSSLPHDAADVFHGQFLEYRVWGSGATGGLHADPLEMNEDDHAAWIDLHVDVHARVDEASGREDDPSRVIDRQKDYASRVVARGIDLRMVRFPPGRL